MVSTILMQLLGTGMWGNANKIMSSMTLREIAAVASADDGLLAE
jgi:hypothetical protein